MQLLRVCGCLIMALPLGTTLLSRSLLDSRSSRPDGPKAWLSLSRPMSWHRARQGPLYREKWEVHFACGRLSHYRLVDRVYHGRSKRGHADRRAEAKHHQRCQELAAPIGLLFSGQSTVASLLAVAVFGIAALTISDAALNRQLSSVQITAQVRSAIESAKGKFIVEPRLAEGQNTDQQIAAEAIRQSLAAGFAGQCSSPQCWLQRERFWPRS
jgi:hypothetical protein